jgi:hypothetical protein
VVNGKLFQIRGAVTEKRRLPSTVLCWFGMTRSSSVEERRARDGILLVANAIQLTDHVLIAGDG